MKHDREGTRRKNQELQDKLKDIPLNLLKISLILGAHPLAIRRKHPYISKQFHKPLEELILIINQ